MSSKFTDFAKAAFLAPATLLSGITDLVFGSYQRNTKGDIKSDLDNRNLTNTGLLGNVLNGIKFAGRAVSNFISNHKQAIAVAFWTSLVLAGAAALTVFLWPAALAAVTTFSIAGVSIASVVGTGLAAQVAAVGVLTAAANSVAVYTVAAVANTISAISTFFADRAAARNAANESRFEELNDETSSEELGSSSELTSSQKLEKLKAQGAQETPFKSAEKNPSNHGSPIASRRPSSVTSEEPTSTATATPSMNG